MTPSGIFVSNMRLFVVILCHFVFVLTLGGLFYQSLGVVVLSLLFLYYFLYLVFYTIAFSSIICIREI